MDLAMFPRRCWRVWSDRTLLATLHNSSFLCPSLPSPGSHCGPGSPGPSPWSHSGLSTSSSPEESKERRSSGGSHCVQKESGTECLSQVCGRRRCQHPSDLHLPTCKEHESWGVTSFPWRQLEVRSNFYMVAKAPCLWQSTLVTHLKLTTITSSMVTTY